LRRVGELSENYRVLKKYRATIWQQKEVLLYNAFCYQGMNKFSYALFN